MWWITNKSFIIILCYLFCLSCHQKSGAVLETPLPNQANQSIVVSKENASTIDESNKPFLALDTCQKIKTRDERSLCKAIVKDQKLANSGMIYEFVYLSERFDLNGDGRKEAIVWLPSRDLGGTSGYPMIVFSKTSKGYQKLFDEVMAWTPILVLKTQSHGWRDIAFQIGGGGIEWHYEIDRFNGKSYDIYQTQQKQPTGELLIDKDWKQSVFGPMTN